MTGKVIGIGNSSGIVIPASLLASLGWKRDDRVTISETSTGFEVRKVERPKTFEELLEGYYGKPYEEAVAQFKSEGDDVEVSWGPARGAEEW